MVKLHPKLKSMVLSVCVGIVSGTTTTMFLISLNWATRYREEHSALINFLPFAGLLIIGLYQRFDTRNRKGMRLIIEEICHPQKTIPFWMGPLIFLSTIITHLFGGSAGREGSAVQFCSTFADQIARFFSLNINQRRNLLMAGASAGFGTAIGAPMAGMFFGMEFAADGKLNLFAWLDCLIASFCAYAISRVLGAPHADFTQILQFDYSVQLIGSVIFCGLIFGLTSRFYITLTHLIELSFAKLFRNSGIKIFCGSIFLLLLMKWEGSSRFYGLGMEQIQQAFSTNSTWGLPLFKLFFTAITIAIGFKGGEFIPLVFIGTTLGSFLTPYFAVATPMLCAIGFVSVFAGASKTPFACSILAAEIFGPHILPLAVLSSFISKNISGPSGIYK